VVALFDGGEERVEVDVEDRPGHDSIIASVSRISTGCSVQGPGRQTAEADEKLPNDSQAVISQTGTLVRREMRAEISCSQLRNGSDRGPERDRPARRPPRGRMTTCRAAGALPLGFDDDRDFG
jgi:hypothetical protein